MAEAIGLKAILDDKEFQAGAARYTKSVQNMESLTSRAARGLTSSFGGIGSAFSAVGNAAKVGLVVGVGAATAALGALSAASLKGIQELNDWAGQIDALGDQFGMTGEQASGFSFLANRVGLSVDEMGMGLNNFTRQLDQTAEDLKKGKKEGTDFTKAMQQLGVRVTDSKGKLRTFDDLLPDIMDKFKKLPAGVDASALAMKLFGARGGSKFLDFLRQGSAGLENARKMAKEFGLEISGDESDAVEEFGFAMNELKLALKGAWVTVGRAALPILREFVGVITRNMPRVTQLIKQAADWFIKNAMPQLRSAATWLARSFIPVLQGLADRVGRLFSSFQVGGLSGFFDELGRQLGGAFKNLDAAKMLGDFGGAVAGALSTAWARISPELSKWSGQFWGWLTGKGGALEQTAAQLGKVVTAMASWLGNPANTAPIWSAVRGWVTSFWTFLTDPQKGLLISVAENMEKLAKAIENWSKDPGTVEWMYDIGAKVANDILDGMGRLFDRQSEGEGLLIRLARTLYNAASSLSNVFQNLGNSIARTVANGIANQFVSGGVGQQVANAIANALYQALSILIGPGGPLIQIGIRIADAIRNAITGGISSGTSGFGGGGGTIPPSPGPNYYWDPAQNKWVWKGKTYQSGGWVMQTAPALLHAGEYVLNRAQVRAMMPMLSAAPVTTNNYTFSHTWNGGTGGMSRTEIETIVQTATFQSMRQVLARG